MRPSATHIGTVMPGMSVHSSVGSSKARRDWGRLVPAALTTCATVAVLLQPVPASAAVSYRIFGTVNCPVGKNPVGVWVQSSGGGSKFADWKRFPVSPNVAYFSKYISTNLPTDIELRVGCGGTKERWGSTNIAPRIRIASGAQRALTVFCNGAGSCSWAPNMTNPLDSKTVNPVGKAYRCQCTYYAADKWKAATGRYPNWKLPNGSGRIGHAISWDDNAARIGWKVVSVPRPRSLFVDNSGTYGHVGWVEDVRINADKTLSIKISDQNSDGRNTCYVRTGKWIKAKTSMRYIVPRPKAG